MQILNAAPRDALTVAQVTALLTTGALQVGAGLELLSSSLVVTADISDDLAGGTVDRSMNATIHGTCKLDISRALTWGTALVRPYMALTDGVISARFHLGVYSLTTPERNVGLTPETYSCQGFDRLYLLNRPVGDTYAIASGTGYLAAVSAAIAAAGLTGVSLDSTASAKTLPADLVWPLLPPPSTGVNAAATQTASSAPATWLNIINDLLGAIGYRGLWADQDGNFRSEPYANPSVRPVEFTFDTGSLTIVGEDRTFTQDLWSVPNRWVFIQQNPTSAPVEGAGQYTVNDTSNAITSQTSCGLVWAKVVQIPAADQASLVLQGDATVAADQRVAQTLKVTVGPFPPAGHWDVYAYSDVLLSAQKVVCSQWTLPLDGSDVSMIWDVVI